MAQENLNEKPPSGPWDVPLKDFVKSFLLMVSIYDIENDKLIKSERLDYGNYEHRKFLGRITYWATSNGYSVETMALADYEKINDDEKTLQIADDLMKEYPKTLNELAKNK